MTGSQTFTSIFTNIDSRFGQYIIDRWQRHYEWSKVQWTNLFETISKIELTTDKKPSKWIGNFICFYPNGQDCSGDAVVVDGQQRLTTITVIMSVIRDLSKLVSSDDNTLSKKIERLLVDRDLHPYIVYKNDPTTNTVYASIVTDKFSGLSENYKSNIFYHAYKFYENSLKNYTYQDLENFYEKLLCLHVNINICDSEKEAKETYQDVNGKNKPVSENDKIKAHICDIIDSSGIDQNKKDEYNVRINDISKTLNTGMGKSFYCRYLYFKEGVWYRKGKISEHIIKYLNNIECINEIFELYSYENTYSAYNDFSHPALVVLYNDLKKYNIPLNKQSIILNTFISAIIRSTIAGQGTIHEEAFCGVVKKINDYIELPANKLIEKIKLDLISSKQLNKNEISIISDDVFIEKIKEFNLYNARHDMAKYILWKLNYYYEDMSNSKEHISIENPSIDHIDPQVNNSIYKNLLGNLTILSQPANSSKNKNDVSNHNSLLKFKNSSLKINKALWENYDLTNGWNDDDILNRTHELANILIKIF